MLVFFFSKHDGPVTWTVINLSDKFIMVALFQCLWLWGGGVMWGSRMGHTEPPWSSSWGLSLVPHNVCELRRWWASHWRHARVISESTGHTDVAVTTRRWNICRAKIWISQLCCVWTIGCVSVRLEWHSQLNNSRNPQSQGGVPSVFAFELHKCLVLQVSKVIYYLRAALKGADSRCFIIGWNNLEFRFLA